MDWSEIVDNPYLQDLPFKIEQDRYGNIVMSPASNRHGRFQSRLARQIEREIEGGEAITECSVQTTEGVKVPDVVWQSDAHFAEHGDATPYTKSPEICVEVLSPSNSTAEIDSKKTLYFAAGAAEVWVCDADGAVSFFGAEGPLNESRIAPDFPTRID